MNTCWDFSNAGNTDEIMKSAFMELWEIFKPEMQFTMWPNPDWHPVGGKAIINEWPPDWELCDQYTTLMGRIGKMMQDEGPHCEIVGSCLSRAPYRLFLKSGRKKPQCPNSILW